MTEASIRALTGLRDLTTLQWYVIPLLAYTFYIYSAQVKKARRAANWDGVLAGLTIFGMDFVNETINGWILHFTQHSALWTAPGPTALRTMVGWNIEIMFMFAIMGLIYYQTISDDPREKILGVPNRWFWAIGYSLFCVFVECLLNKGGLLIWEYPFWTRSFGGVWLIFLFGYFHFFVAAIIVLSLKSLKAKVCAVAGIYAVAVILNIYGLGIMGWRY
ncbi:MAG: hypothetical protein K9K66_05965 [Desulfarculaceae bacterium]|nr:hypothetical protein [Desulfarculaceae bacterium]MCF8071208.1 hypothetical protein [Desulfarculaceae bacterium]MCF8101189.1 hypothetical protein [Desulfarculaceae bacterium]MCF8115262.1 hypothetical protein [Desulfarculaceae bacterium]